MIKKFEEYINEDYFSKLANRKDNNDVRKENEITEDFVRSLVLERYGPYVKSISIRKENGKTIVDIGGDFFLMKDIEEIPFQFGKVTGDFNCTFCKLSSLEGCPEEVGGSFNCSGCDRIYSLNGCPHSVSRDFICSNCKNLKSLDGFPKNIGGNFYNFDCGKKFTKKEVKSLCNVKGRISV